MWLLLFLYIYIFPTSKFSYFKFSWINIVVKTELTRKKSEKFVKTLLKEMITSEYSFFEAKRRNFSTRHRNSLQPITMKMFHFLIKEHCVVFISLCLLYRAPRFDSIFNGIVIFMSICDMLNSINYGKKSISLIWNYICRFILVSVPLTK